MHIWMVLFEPFLALLRRAAIFAVLRRAMRISLLILSFGRLGKIDCNVLDKWSVPLAEACRLTFTVRIRLEYEEVDG